VARARLARRRARGFTLLEIMVAVAILGLGLTTIFAAQAGAFASAGHARNVSVASGLVRCKMSEVEQTLKQEGFQELDVAENGPCCDGVEDAKFSCSWRVEKLELPEEQLGQLDLDSGLDLGGAKGGAKSPDLGTLTEGAMAAKGSGLGGIMSLASQAQSGTATDMSDVASSLAGEEGGMDGLMSFFMGMVYPSLRTAFVEGSRRVTVTITWNEGAKEHAVDVAQWVVDARAAGLLAAAAEEFADEEEDLSTGSTGAAGGPAPAGSGAGRKAPGGGK
jgi:general secretion pathway protein I